jgi:hypothetical protein
MPGRFTAYSLGKVGVSIDKSPIHREEGELSKAQNAIRDPLGVDGGIHKRPGLTKVNAVAAAGVIGGSEAVPLVKPVTRRLIAGRYVDDTTTGWNTSTDGFATSPTTGGPDGFVAVATPRSPDKVWTNFANAHNRQFQFVGNPSVTYRNRFYYAGNDYTVGTTSPTIRVWDGVRDVLLARIPNNPDTGATQATAVLNMIAANGFLYLTTYDGGSYGANTVKGRVFQLNTENGQVVQLGSRFPITPETARVPYSLTWWNGRLWTRTYTGGGTATARTYVIRPGVNTDWTMDNLSSSGSRTTTCMASFQGDLYLGCINMASAAAIVEKRNTLGTYSTARTVALNEGGSVPTMSDFGDYNSFGVMAVFKGSLYATYFNWNGGSTSRYGRIYKYDGSTWTIPYFPAANAATAVPFSAALIHNNTLYLLSSPSFSGVGNLINIIVSTTDGVTWTDVSSALDNSSCSALGVIIT